MDPTNGCWWIQQEVLVLKASESIMKATSETEKGVKRAKDPIYLEAKTALLTCFK
jgi:hypothetical protein